MLTIIILKINKKGKKKKDLLEDFMHVRRCKEFRPFGIAKRAERYGYLSRKMSIPKLFDFTCLICRT